MNISINKCLEFIYAIQAVIKDKYGDPDFDYDFIETPDIPYFHDLCELFKDEDLSDLDYFFKGVLLDEGDSSILGVALDEDFNLKYFPPFNSVVQEDVLNSYILKIKELADRVKWDEFFISHKNTYDGFIKEFANFPENFSLDDFIKLFKVEPNSFIYNPSVLINGGFGISDNETNFYYLKGFRYIKESNEFRYYLPAVVECLFHEFSHPVVNPLVDKYFDLLDDPYKLYDYAVSNNLHSSYSASLRTVYYEYMVRTVAYVLNVLYYPDYDIEMDYQESIGFDLLDQFVDKFSCCISKYDDFESIYVNEMIPFINNLNLGKKM